MGGQVSVAVDDLCQCAGLLQTESGKALLAGGTQQILRLVANAANIHQRVQVIHKRIVSILLRPLPGPDHIIAQAHLFQIHVQYSVHVLNKELYRLPAPCFICIVHAQKKRGINKQRALIQVH